MQILPAQPNKFQHFLLRWNHQSVKEAEHSATVLLEDVNDDLSPFSRATSVSDRLGKLQFVPIQAQAQCLQCLDELPSMLLERANRLRRFGLSADFQLIGSRGAVHCLQTTVKLDPLESARLLNAAS